MLHLERVTVLQGGYSVAADFVVPRGARVAILGPSGAGKSTLLASIGGYASLMSGRIRWGDHDLTDLPPSGRPIASVFQDNNLFPHMTAAQNVGLGVKPNLRLSQQERASVAEALSVVGLDGLGERRPSALSGGQQSRVALARLLLQNRPLMLLDEPFSALGPAMRRDMVDLTRDIAERLEATVLMVSHDVDDVKRFADFVVWVEAGVCHPPRALAEFLNDPPDGFKAYVGT